MKCWKNTIIHYQVERRVLLTLQQKIQVRFSNSLVKLFDALTSEENYENKGEFKPSEEASSAAPPPPLKISRWTLGEY